MFTSRRCVMLRSIWTEVRIRFFGNVNNQHQEVRVRFAPSPTGHLHLGGLRTALYNYLFAKSHKGKFILRIEDTDQSRIVPGAVSKLEDDLNWVGIHPNESPMNGGSFGPYVQSERLVLYKEKVDHLLGIGAAYHCFCTDRRLDLLRREALKAQQVPRYDNRCRHLSPSEVDDKLRLGEGHCVRFKLSPAEGFNDLIYGLVTCDSAHQEGDPVIFKTDSFPTYHLANVVDDHTMQISHVLRGVEWQISTQKHLQLYRAFGWEPPQFGHLPLILNADGSKLSKRQGDVQVDHYRSGGIFPLALVNYVTNAGGGFDRRAGAKPCISTLKQLTDQFDLSLVNVNSCRLTPDRLPRFNGLELGRQLGGGEGEGTDQLVGEVRRLVADRFADSTGELQLHRDHILAVLTWAVSRIHRLADLVETDLAFLWIVPDVGRVGTADISVDILEDLKSSLEQMSEAFVNQDVLKRFLKEFSAKHSLPFNKLMKHLRHVLSGLKEGPGVAEMMSVLGQTSTVTRLDRIITGLKR